MKVSVLVLFAACSTDVSLDQQSSALAMTWSTTGPLQTPRIRESVSELAHGQVLIAGGFDSATGAPTATAELYDPATDRWTATGAMATPRAAPFAAALADGRVLVGGGRGTTGAILRSVEIYDPASGTFSATGSLGIARENTSAVMLADGRLLVTGGDTNTHAIAERSAEVFDPTSGTWSFVGSMKAARYIHGAARLADGRVLVAGGVVHSHCDAFPETELFSPATGTFTPTGALHVPHSALIPATISVGGSVMIVGGYTAGKCLQVTADVERFDPATGRWRVLAPLAEARAGVFVAPLPDGRVAAIGGLIAFGSEPTATVEIYDPDADVWSAGPSLPEPTIGRGVVLHDGSILLVGDTAGYRLR